MRSHYIYTIRFDSKLNDRACIIYIIYTRFSVLLVGCNFINFDVAFNEYKNNWTGVQLLYFKNSIFYTVEYNTIISNTFKSKKKYVLYIL